MWLSKMLSKSDKTMTAESGSVTLSDKNTCEIVPRCVSAILIRILRTATAQGRRAAKKSYLFRLQTVRLCSALRRMPRRLKAARFALLQPAAPK